MFCTDDKSAEDIKENGCTDNALRIAVKCGISPVSAIKWQLSTSQGTMVLTIS